MGGDMEDDLHQLSFIQTKKEALESSTGILELGLAEFPGCALLHLYYLTSLAEYCYQTDLVVRNCVELLKWRGRMWGGDLT
jgi:hypothetical protein